jgi:hypothetical protein
MAPVLIGRLGPVGANFHCVSMLRVNVTRESMIGFVSVQAFTD